MSNENNPYSFKDCPCSALKLRSAWYLARRTQGSRHTALKSLDAPPHTPKIQPLPSVFEAPLLPCSICGLMPPLATHIVRNCTWNSELLKELMPQSLPSEKNVMFLFYVRNRPTLSPKNPGELRWNTKCSRTVLVLCPLRGDGSILQAELRSYVWTCYGEWFIWDWFFILLYR